MSRVPSNSRGKDRGMSDAECCLERVVANLTHPIYVPHVSKSSVGPAVTVQQPPENNDYLWVLLAGVATFVLIAIGWIRSKP